MTAMNELRIKKWFLVIILSAGFLGFSRLVAGAESYYINNNRVLLYKVINWWYDCLPEVSEQLCGQILTYRDPGSMKVAYDEDNRVVKLIVPNRFTDIVSLFGGHSRQKEGRSFTCTFRQKEIFGPGQSMDVTDVFISDGAFVFKGIASVQAQKIQEIRDAMVFEVTGSIRGLMDGKIALSPGGDFIRSCPADSLQKIAFLPVTMKVYHAGTNEILLIYSGLN